MLLVVSALMGHTLKGSDGDIGKVSDVLFDDKAWKVRWLVVDTGGWFSDREILVRPSSVTAADGERLGFYTDLTKLDLKNSPDSRTDLPVSRQRERRLYSRFGWDPLLGNPGAMASAFSPPPLFRDVDWQVTPDDSGQAPGNPSLRSVIAVTGYRAEASDGAIGHVENFIINDESWSLDYVMIDTKDWWFRQHVLLSVQVVQEIRWSDRQMWLNVDRDQVRASPPWEPLREFDKAYAMQLRDHYSWSRYDTSEAKGIESVTS